jgi:hypothetical protein
MPAALKYTCPVCGFAGLVDPPIDYTICPCCGTVFEYDNSAVSNEQLRAIWIQSGAHWFAGDEWPQPADWNPSMQLAVAGLNRQIVTSDVGLTADKMDALWPRLPEITLASTAGQTDPKAA